MQKMYFEWDEKKNLINQQKHGISFFEAQSAFLDSHRIIVEDLDHSLKEKRYFCIGQVDGEIVTVRFTLREDTIRIFGAGYWRKGRKLYEQTKR